MDIVLFENILGSLFNCEIVEEDSKTFFKYRSLEYIIDEERVVAISNNLTNFNHKENTVLYTNTYYETLVSFESRRMPISQLEERLKIVDNQNKVSYEITKASDEYLLFMLNNLYEHQLLREFRRRSVMVGSFILDRASEYEDLFDFLRLVFRMLYTLRITAEDNKNIHEFENLNNSFLFHIAYNYDTSIVEIKLLQEFVSSNRLERMRRNSEEIGPPKRRYLPDLVHHYQMAVSTESPYLQFISYYHIMEHFFEKVYNEELIRTVQNEISNPGFSIKRDNDVKKVIRVITKKIQSRKEEYSINEKEALELTLHKYIDIETIKQKLDEYDNSLLNFYKENDVVFSGGNKIDFNENQERDVIKKVASRIYATRNSIVHSKDNEKLKYTPFKHDKYLIKEIPLLRFLAEEIIISNSQLI